MKLSEQWLREWVNPQASIREIADRLVMGGLELEIEPAVAEMPKGVVVGRIVSIAPHPNAERLRVCEVDAGAAGMPTIVCGAANARVGMVAPVALPGARLAGGLEIRASALRGVDSGGMLCSASELGLADKSEGLLELDPDARPGTPIEKHLALDDRILNLEITPNRGDCLSVVGLAREVAALFGVNMTRPRVKPAVVVGEQRHAVEIENPADCTHYAGRVVYGLNAKARTPDWMRERLRRSGVRSIQPLVDITNYVMLELGQPMHAFDESRLVGTVRVRRARPGEKLTLLNDQALELNHHELLICDDTGPIALAGVMGGTSTAVSLSTARVFFESACFSMSAVAGTGRRHKLASDALYRFERGVDPDLQRHALERATELTAQLCGGESGPVSQAGRSHQAEPVRVKLRLARLNKLLGHEIAAKDVEMQLSRLGITTRNEIGGTWTAAIPSWRHDLRIEADLIEEIARLHGYDRIPARPYPALLAPARPRETERSLASARQLLASRGWQEVISLAFVDPKIQAALDPHCEVIAVDNPLADNLAVMRSTLWCGLVEAWRYNHARQITRLRLMETGVCFARENGRIVETTRAAGLAAGSVFPEQWGERARPTDFFDVKAQVEALLGSGPAYRFQAAPHPALHPGRSARILCGERQVGWIGELHPRLAGALDLPSAGVVFELDWAAIRDTDLPVAHPVPEFPAARRDLALVVPGDLPAQALRDAVRRAAPPVLREVFVFDVYRDENLGATFKSVALGLIFQDYSRTLTVEEIDSAVSAIKAEVTGAMNITVRT